ncbi:hypothetical protein [Micromonospora sp. NPDC126480]|uniref:hypothetical protein n=1 Tax=Micromonospora sp. NPDC126480 TaxID=3155312 RepID=UPI003329DD52
MARHRETIEEQMARAQQKPKATSVRTSTSSRGVRAPSRSAIVLLTVSVLAALWAATMLTGVGSSVYAYGFFFTEFFAGVIALVALSLTVMLGLLATDRLVLMIRHRVLLQSAHRATGILGVAGLVFHAITKIATGRAGSTDALIPFVSGRGLYVGLGTVAGLLMVSVLWTGIIRARFAGVGPKWLWRTLHSAAYLSWPFAILHGLNAGRPAAPWVIFSYLACVLLVVLALLVRLSVTLQRRSREQHQAAAMNKAMTARVTDDGKGRALLGGVARKRDGDDRRESRRDSTWSETTLAGTWSAPGSRRRDPERFTVPVVPEPGSLREPAPRRRRDEPALEPARRERPARRRTEDAAPARSRRRTQEYETVAARRDERPSRRREEEYEAEVVRRDERPSRRREEEYEAEVVRRDERPSRRRDEEAAPAGRRRRDDADSYGSRRSRDETDAGSRYPAPPRRRDDEPEEPWTSPRRWASAPISAGPISAGPVSAGPVSGTPISSAPRSGGGRHSAEDDVPEEPDYWRPPARYAPEEAPLPPDDTPTLVDLASRRARRAESKRRRRRADADSVDIAYLTELRGEAK